MSHQQVNIAIADDHLEDFVEVACNIKNAGVKVDQQLKTVGVVTGTVSRDKVPAVRQISGVSSVEPSRAFQIAPPESDVQ